MRGDDERDKLIPKIVAQGPMTSQVGSEVVLPGETRRPPRPPGDASPGVQFALRSVQPEAAAPPDDGGVDEHKGGDIENPLVERLRGRAESRSERSERSRRRRGRRAANGPQDGPPPAGPYEGYGATRAIPSVPSVAAPRPSRGSIDSVGSQGRRVSFGKSPSDARVEIVFATPAGPGHALGLPRIYL